MINENTQKNVGKLDRPEVINELKLETLPSEKKESTTKPSKTGEVHYEVRSQKTRGFDGGAWW